MRITQGTFSFLPDLSDEQITRQIAYCLDNGWSVSIEHTDDPHPRNTYWEMWGPPMFDLKDPAGVMAELKACRATFPRHYIRVGGLDASLGFESLRLSFIVNRPPDEPGFRLERSERPGRTLGFTTHAYATDKPPGDRYQGRHDD